MNKKIKLMAIGGGTLVLLLVAAEVTLRMAWGFGKMPPT